MPSDNRFSGAPYPLTTDAQGYFHTVTGTETIKSDLLILLMTNPGERVMLPMYGTPLRSLVFEQNDKVVEQKARDIITKAIKKWEPRVRITQLVVSAGVDRDFLPTNDNGTEKDHVLGISIKFHDFNNITDIQELVLEVPLNG